jgi:hypothetical protein
MNPERVMSMLCQAKGVDMRGVSRATGERWTTDDAAMACSAYVDRRGNRVVLSEPAMFAARFRWAIDMSVKSTLWSYLFQEAIDLRDQEGWPKTIKRLDMATGKFNEERYLEDLVELALLEEHRWFLIKQADLYHQLMRVQPFFWSRKLSRRYEGIRLFLHRWCGDAYGHVARKLRYAHESSG